MTKSVKIIEAIAADLERQGARIRPGTGRNNKIVILPVQEDAKPIALHLTPGDPRWRQNLRGSIRQAGFEVPEELIRKL